MTNYGAIPTSSHPAETSSLEFVSRAKGVIKSSFSARRPWKLMFDYHSIALPHNISDAFTRIKTNIAYFRVNYTIIALIVLFVSLLWHPISLIVFIVMMTAWLFLYFLRDEPLVVLHRTIDDRVVMIVLAVATVGLLLLTDAKLNILIAVLIGVVFVVVHAAFRKTEDLYEDVEEAGSSAPLS